MEKDFLENNTVDGNNPINWEEIIKKNVDIRNRKRPLLNNGNLDDSIDLDDEEVSMRKK